MKFAFPLQKVLEHRKILENLAQKDFQEAEAAFSQQQVLLQKLKQAVQEAYAQAGQLSQKGGAQGPALSQIDEFIRDQKIRITTQTQKVQDAEKLVESKREVLRQAALDYKIIEKMRENRLEAYKAELLSQERKEMDEQAILRFKVAKES
ncbi:MAG TPA: flagellar export protein FliJ [Bdellovibrio sp.]|nr:flagellar export protein FliJ [Bdellovibrio sp.]